MFDIFNTCHGRSQVNPSRTEYKRVHYVHGMVLSADDFQQEQEYFRSKNRRHNRYMHGSGVIEGLCLSLELRKLKVSPGFAIDCLGDEIEVQSAVEANLSGLEGDYFIVVRYKESEIDPLPVPGMPVGKEEDNLNPSRILESFEITFEKDDPIYRHKRRRCGLLPCGESHGIPLGLLKSRGDRRWISRWFRRPKVR